MITYQNDGFNHDDKDGYDVNKRTKFEWKDQGREEGPGSLIGIHFQFSWIYRCERVATVDGGPAT